MAKRSSSRSILNFILTALLILMLISFAMVLVKRFMPTNTGVIAAVTVDKKTYKTGDSLGAIDSGTKIDVIGAGTYTVTVTAYIDEDGEDFNYAVGGETYSWKTDAASAEKDLTKAFEVKTVETAVLSDGFTLNFGGIDDVLSKTYGMPATAETKPEGNIFKLTIKSKNEFSIYFGINSTVKSITLDKTSICF